MARNYDAHDHKIRWILQNHQNRVFLGYFSIFVNLCIQGVPGGM